MGILEGKRLLITGVLTDASIAFAVARLAQEEGAELILTGAGRGLSLTRRTALKLTVEPEVLEVRRDIRGTGRRTQGAPPRPLGQHRRCPPRHRICSRDLPR